MAMLFTAVEAPKSIHSPCHIHRLPLCSTPTLVKVSALATRVEASLFPTPKLSTHLQIPNLICHASATGSSRPSHPTEHLQPAAGKCQKATEREATRFVTSTSPTPIRKASAAPNGARAWQNTPGHDLPPLPQALLVFYGQDVGLG